ncbi:hypothetical protein D5S18_03700 [Nocardia panacis]|uniref:Transposase IS701-like DDE domain-containing protein n=1 Tax=Nocardia panacis TaxID=2340916 RepID=A0A3A4KHJ1_9NOCA|nr:transposase [Nocardia panacis]RJO78954.1 hypothetical protein D5S18_03700 [Nocardia panacis]
MIYGQAPGRIENCQLGVFCAHTTVKGRTLMDRELYLPKSWTVDRDRCQRPGCRRMSNSLRNRFWHNGCWPVRRVTADKACGGDSKFRGWLKRLRIGYVVAVPSSAPIVSLSGSQRADQVVADAPTEAWKRLSGGEGAKGPRLFDWAVATLPTVSEAGTGWRRWLLARRSLPRNARGELEIAYYLCGAQAGTNDDDLIRVAGARWSVEDCF